MAKTLPQYVQEAVSLKEDIDNILETVVKPKEEMLKALKGKLKREMTADDLKELKSENGLGIAKIVDNKGRETLDEGKVCEALGVEDLSEYKKRGAGYSYVKLSQVKPEIEID